MQIRLAKLAIINFERVIKLETRVLKYFLKIADTGNMSKAAQELHVTQPTLSRQIHSLEVDLGTQLFSRDNKKMTLTSAGIMFQERAQQIVQMIDKTTQDLQNQNGLKGVITIGCVESSVARFVGKMVAQFHQRFPQIHFSLYDADAEDIKEKLDNNLVDLGFVLSPVEIAKYEYLSLPVTDQWGLVVLKDSAIAKQDDVALDQLPSLPLIVPARRIVQDEVSSWMQIPANQLKIVGSQNLLSNSLFMVKDGIGDALCAKESFSLRPDPALTFVPIKTKEQIHHMMIWPKNHSLTPATKKFIELVKDQLLKQKVDH